MSLILFDTETTGLVKSAESPDRIQPRLIQFYGMRCNPANPEEILETLEILVDPKIPRSEWKVIKEIGEDGSKISAEDLVGAPTFPEALPRLQAFFLGAATICAHNLTFDLQMLHSELKRLDAVTRFPWPPHRICTVEASEQISGRRMNLTDLHTYLFGEGFGDAHLASADVKAMHRCFVELWKRGFISIAGQG